MVFKTVTSIIILVNPQTKASKFETGNQGLLTRNQKPSYKMRECVIVNRYKRSKLRRAKSSSRHYHYLTSCVLDCTQHLSTDEDLPVKNVWNFLMKIPWMLQSTHTQKTIQSSITTVTFTINQNITPMKKLIYDLD